MVMQIEVSNQPENYFFLYSCMNHVKKEQVSNNGREQGERGKMSKGAGRITPLTEPQYTFCSKNGIAGSNLMKFQIGVERDNIVT